MYYPFNCLFIFFYYLYFSLYYILFSICYILLDFKIFFYSLCIFFYNYFLFFVFLIYVLLFVFTLNFQFGFLLCGPKALRRSHGALMDSAQFAHSSWVSGANQVVGEPVRALFGVSLCF